MKKNIKTVANLIVILIAFAMNWVPVPTTPVALATTNCTEANGTTPCSFSITSDLASNSATAQNHGSSLGVYVASDFKDGAPSAGEWGNYPKSIDFTTTLGHTYYGTYPNDFGLRAYDYACSRYLSTPTLGQARGTLSASATGPDQAMADNFDSPGDCASGSGRWWDGGYGVFMPVEYYGSWGLPTWSETQCATTGVGCPTTRWITPSQIPSNATLYNPNFNGSPVLWKTTAPNHNDQEQAAIGTTYNSNYGALYSNGMSYFRIEFDFTDAQWDWIRRGGDPTYSNYDPSYNSLSSFNLTAGADDFLKVYLNGFSIAQATQSQSGTIVMQNTDTNESKGRFNSATGIFSYFRQHGNVVAIQAQDKAIWAKTINGSPDTGLIDANKAGLTFNAAFTFNSNSAVSPQCNLSAKPLNGVAPLVVTIDSNPSNLPVGATFTYDMGDGTAPLSSKGRKIYYTYTKPSPAGGFNIRATASDGTTCNATNVIVKPPTTGNGGEVAP